MCSTVSSDRRSAAVRAILNFDSPPTATYRRDADRITISVGSAAIVLSPGAARDLAHSLAGAVTTAEGHRDPDAPGDTESEPSGVEAGRADG